MSSIRLVSETTNNKKWLNCDALYVYQAPGDFPTCLNLEAGKCNGSNLCPPPGGILRCPNTTTTTTTTSTSGCCEGVTSGVMYSSGMMSSSDNNNLGTIMVSGYIETSRERNDFKEISSTPTVIGAPLKNSSLGDGDVKRFYVRDAGMYKVELNVDSSIPLKIYLTNSTHSTSISGDMSLTNGGQMVLKGEMYADYNSPIIVAFNNGSNTPANVTYTLSVSK